MTYESKTKIRLDGRKVIHLRAAKKWSQRTAAKKAKVDYATYRSAETGADLQAIKAARIATLYGVNLADLEMKESA